MSEEPFIQAFRVQGLDVEMHKHAAYQLVYAVDGVFDTVVGGVRHEDIAGFLIAPNVAHQCSVGGRVLMVLNVEPDSAPGRGVQEVLAGRSSVVFEEFEALQGGLGLPDDVPRAQAHPYVSSALDPETEREVGDARVARAIATVRQRFGQPLRSAQVAGEVGLSPSRFRAVFKQQVGSSFTKFLLWTRLRRAVDRVLSDESATLTDIAVDCGFYDLPQFNRYMAEMVGVPPSMLRARARGRAVPAGRGECMDFRVRGRLP